MHAQVDSARRGTVAFLKAFFVPDLSHLVPRSSLNAAEAAFHASGSVQDIVSAAHQETDAQRQQWVAKLEAGKNFLSDPLTHVGNSADRVNQVFEQWPTLAANLKHADPETKGTLLGLIGATVMTRSGSHALSRNLFFMHEGSPSITAFTARKNYVPNAQSDDVVQRISVPIQGFEDKVVYAKHRPADSDALEFLIYAKRHVAPSPNGANVPHQGLEKLIRVDGRDVDSPLYQLTREELGARSHYRHGWTHLPDPLTERSGRDFHLANTLVGYVDLKYGWTVPTYRTKRDYEGLNYTLVPIKDIHFYDPQTRSRYGSPNAAAGAVDPALRTELTERGFDVMRAPKALEGQGGIWISDHFTPLVSTAKKLGMNEIPVRVQP